MSTFYRLLRQASGTRERRSQAAHPATVNPELLAPEPNVAWSWDITQLRDPQTWLWFYLCEILDIYSRYVVGWMVASRESAPGADPADRCQARDLPRATDHPRRPWQPMRSKPVAFLLADLDITQSHSPYVYDDNPFSEAQFKTLKYRPDFPDRFVSMEAARAHCVDFFAFYDDEHRHTESVKGNPPRRDGEIGLHLSAGPGVQR
jgi:putative transposase